MTITTKLFKIHVKWNYTEIRMEKKCSKKEEEFFGEKN